MRPETRVATFLFSSQNPTENGTPVTGYTLEWMEDGTFIEVLQWTKSSLISTTIDPDFKTKLYSRKQIT